MKLMRYLFWFILGAFYLGVSGQTQSIYFKHVDESWGKAFSLLIPAGWTIDGDAIRITSDQIAGAANMVDHKFDMAAKNDQTGSVMIYWLPEMMCLDQSRYFGYPKYLSSIIPL